MDPLPATGPPPFNPNDHGTDTAQAFERWVERFEIFCDHILDDPPRHDAEARAQHLKAKKKKLLWFIGESGLHDIQSLCPNARTDEQKTYDVIINALRLHYRPRSSRWQAIAQYRSLQQEPGESISKFADRCRRSAALCGFDSDEFNEGCPITMATKIQLVLGTTNQTLRDAVIQKNWCLNEAVTNGTLFEDSALASQSVKLYLPLF